MASFCGTLTDVAQMAGMPGLKNFSSTVCLRCRRRWPENMALTAESEMNLMNLKILDFGLSTSYEAGKRPESSSGRGRALVPVANPMFIEISKIACTCVGGGAGR